MPRLNGSRSTVTPFAAATSAVRSTEPSSTTTMSIPESNARSSSITRAIVCSSFSAGTIAIQRSASDTHGHRHAQEIEQAAGSVRVGVLLEHALARAPSEFRGKTAVGEQLLVRVHCFVGVSDDDDLLARLEPA